MNRQPLRFDWLIERLGNGRRAHYSRWGDGEWNSVLGLGGKSLNADGCAYTPKLQQLLRVTLLAYQRSYEKDYRLGLLSIARRIMGPQIKSYCKAVSLECMFYTGDFLLDTFLDAPADFMSLIRYGRDRGCIYVGPERLKQTATAVFHPAAYITVPETDAVSDYDGIQQRIRLAVRAHNPQLIFYSAGMISNALIGWMYKQNGRFLSQVDMGSALDGVAGFQTRTYIRANPEKFAALRDFYTGG